MVVDRFSLPSLRIDSTSATQNTFCAAEPNDALALVPYRPSLHAVLIAIWATAQPEPLDAELTEQHSDVILTEDSLPVTQADNANLASSTLLASNPSGFVSSGSVSDDHIAAKKCLAPF